MARGHRTRQSPHARSPPTRTPPFQRHQWSRGNRRQPCALAHRVRQLQHRPGGVDADPGPGCSHGHTTAHLDRRGRPWQHPPGPGGVAEAVRATEQHGGWLVAQSLLPVLGPRAPTVASAWPGFARWAVLGPAASRATAWHTVPRSRCGQGTAFPRPCPAPLPASHQDSSRTGRRRPTASRRLRLVCTCPIRYSMLPRFWLRRLESLARTLTNVQPVTPSLRATLHGLEGLWAGAAGSGR
jgi:hypothetical protein